MRIQPKHCALWWPIVSDVCYLRISNWMVPVAVVLEKFAASKSWWEIVSIIKLIKNHSLCIESSVYKNLGMRKVVCIIWDFEGVVCIVAVISMITSPWFRTLVNFVFLQSGCQSGMVGHLRPQHATILKHDIAVLAGTKTLRRLSSGVNECTSYHVLHKLSLVTVLIIFRVTPSVV